MFDLISEIPGCEVTAFVENMDPDRCSLEIEGLPVLWVDQLAGLAETHTAICALGTTHRSRFIEQAAAVGMSFATLIHPTARVSSRAVLGEGCFVSAQAVVSTRTRLAPHVFVNRGVLIGHHVRIGSYCSLQCGANIAGNAVIGDATYVGMSAAVLHRVTIGKGCVIAAGAVVTRDLPDHVQAVGMPARIVKTDIEGM